MSERVSDELLAKPHAFDSTTENAKRHEDVFDGFYCVKCGQSQHVPAELDPTALCEECLFPAFDALVAEVIGWRSGATQLMSMKPPRISGRRRK